MKIGDALKVLSFLDEELEVTSVKNALYIAQGVDVIGILDLSTGKFFECLPSEKSVPKSSSKFSVEDF